MAYNAYLSFWASFFIWLCIGSTVLIYIDYRVHPYDYVMLEYGESSWHVKLVEFDSGIMPSYGLKTTEWLQEEGWKYNVGMTWDAKVESYGHHLFFEFLPYVFVLVIGGVAFFLFKYLNRRL